MTARFVAVTTVGELGPGTMRCVALEGRRVLLANVAGRIFATDDTCTHEDASLSTGVLSGEMVRCPLHGSRFNLCTGEALEEPAEVPLRTHAVRLEGDRILVRLSETAAP